MSKLLARILLVLALLAPAIAYTPSHDGHAATPQQDMVLFSGKVVPVASADFTKLSALTIPSWLRHSRTGGAMQWDSTATLTYAPNNLYINSGSATSTARTITTVAGVNYYIWIQTSSGSATIVASGTNTTTFNGSAAGTWTAFTATAGTLTLTPTSNFANITQVVVAQITYETALRAGDNVVTGASAYYGPRFDYDPSTLLPRGLLIEESRTNSALNSSTPSSWLTANVSYSAGGLSPDGASTYGLFTGTAGAAAHEVYSALSSVSNGVTYTASAFVKAGTANAAFIAVKLDATGNGMSAVVALDGTSDVSAIVTGAGTNVTIASSGGKYLGGGVYRIWVTGSISTGAGSPYIIVGQAQKTGNTLNPNSGEVTNSPGSLTMSAWGWQFETGSFATSYIPTTGAPVTRAGDMLRATSGGVADVALQASTGTFVSEIAAMPAGSIANGPYAVRRVGQDGLAWGHSTSINHWNGSVQLLVNGPDATTQTTRSAIAWSPAGRTIAYGGFSATDANTVGTSAQAAIGSNEVGGRPINSWLRAIAIYNRRLPDATLKRISNVGASFLAANDDFPRYAENDNLPIIWRRAM